MLRYLGLGQRRLGDYPRPPHKRVNWEFLAVIRGKCAPVLEDTQISAPAESTLWLFPPGYAHGWQGEAGRKCEVVVLHFNAVPAAVERTVQEQGYLTLRLDAADRAFLRSLGQRLKPHYWQPVGVSDIHTERALMDLSLLVLRDVAVSRQPCRVGSGLSQVVSAESWLREHLAERPSIAQAARAIGISPSHLRRLFRAVRKSSPKQVQQKLRLENAMQLMAQSRVKLDHVAQECGFISASNFCRAFKAFNGSTPAAWRREIYIQYRQPRPGEKADYRRHGRRRKEL